MTGIGGLNDVYAILFCFKGVRSTTPLRLHIVEGEMSQGASSRGDARLFFITKKVTDARNPGSGALADACDPPNPGTGRTPNRKSHVSKPTTASSRMTSRGNRKNRTPGQAKKRAENEPRPSAGNFFYFFIMIL
jgi:hypothetical protein